MNERKTTKKNRILQIFLFMRFIENDNKKQQQQHESLCRGTSEK